MEPARIRRVLRQTALMTAFVSAAFHLGFCLWWFRFGLSGVLMLAAPIAAIGFASVYFLVIASGRLALVRIL